MRQLGAIGRFAFKLNGDLPTYMMRLISEEKYTLLQVQFEQIWYKNSMIYQGLGLAYYFTGDWEKALKAFKKADKNPTVLEFIDGIKNRKVLSNPYKF